MLSYLLTGIRFMIAMVIMFAAMMLASILAQVIFGGDAARNVVNVLFPTRLGGLAIWIGLAVFLASKLPWWRKRRMASETEGLNSG